MAQRFHFLVLLALFAGLANGYISKVGVRPIGIDAFSRRSNSLLQKASIRTSATLQEPPTEAPSSATGLLTTQGEVAEILLTNYQEWLQEQSLNRLFTKDSALTLTREMKRSEYTVKQGEVVFKKYWVRSEAVLREETRSLKEFLGDDTTEKILRAVGSTNIYEPKAVKAFLLTPAFEKMIGNIVYEGIFEFMGRVDFISPIVDGLPMIGPVKKGVQKQMKSILDNSLGGQIKTFLGTFNAVGLNMMVDFVLSEQNRGALMRANVNVIDTVLSQKVNEMLPQGQNSDQLASALYGLQAGLSEEDLTKLVDVIYDAVGDIVFKEVFDLNAVVSEIPSLRANAIETMEKFMRSEYGQETLKAVRDKVSDDPSVIDIDGNVEISA